MQFRRVTVKSLYMALRKMASEKTTYTNSSSPSARVGSFLRDKRISAGVSEWEILQYMPDMTLNEIRDYESGRKAIPVSYVYAMSNRLNIAPQEIQQLLKK